MQAVDAPLILGIRHHSPACARLVAERIRTLRPAFVLIEGPVDFNDRLAELYLAHRLPIAIYSYLSDDAGHRGSWSPLAEHSPEWQALQVGRAVGAELRFIDLPAWHEAFTDMENRYADTADAQHADRAQAYEQALAKRLAVQGRDALWDHLFESMDAVQMAPDALAERLATYFEHLRADDPGSLGNQAREDMMARWIAWAMARAQGAPVVVVCGGYHASVLARLWSTRPAAQPETPAPPETADGPTSGEIRHGSYLIPYTFKRLDAFTGYASGMPSPAWYQWQWEGGNAGAARHALQRLMQRLRDKQLPASTADLQALHLRAQGLALVRGHAEPLRCDWLDALAGALVKNALDAPLPWTTRGPLRAGTDPVLVEAMDVLAGDAVGMLDAATPQPPLLQSVHAELEALGIVLRGTLVLDLLQPDARAKSRVLHRLAILRLPGIVRSHGPREALSREHTERWQLGQPLEQQAALIEAGAWGATLADAARAKLEAELRQAQGRIVPLAAGLNRAAWAGLSTLGEALLNELQTAMAAESRFEALAPALGALHSLLRHGQWLGMAGAPVLRTVIEAGFDRALWLMEPPAAIAAADVDEHLHGQQALRQIVADVLARQAGHDEEDAESGPALRIEAARAIAVWQRKAADATAAPLGRGAALGAVLSLAGRLELAPDPQLAPAPPDADDALQLLAAMPAAVLGDALTGLLALAREQLASEPAFAAGMDRRVQALDGADFVQALPALRAAFAWLPPQERGALADQLLALHQAQHLPRRVLTGSLPANVAPQALARARQIEEAVATRLAAWGIDKL